MAEIKVKLKFLCGASHCCHSLAKPKALKTSDLFAFFVAFFCCCTRFWLFRLSHSVNTEHNIYCGFSFISFWWHFFCCSGVILTRKRKRHTSYHNMYIFNAILLLFSRRFDSVLSFARCLKTVLLVKSFERKCNPKQHNKRLNSLLSLDDENKKIFV